MVIRVVTCLCGNFHLANEGEQDDGFCCEICNKKYKTEGEAKECEYQCNCDYNDGG